MRWTPIRRIGLLGLLGLATIGSAGCGATAGMPDTAAAAPATAAAQATPPVARAPTGPRSVETAQVRLRPRRPASVRVRAAGGYGRLLVDGKGRTLYLFTADRGGTSVCNGACAAAWPPLLGRNAGGVGPGLAAGRLSRIRRSDGRFQLAYYGHPLYYYVGDRAAGEINCQDAEEYGGHWWLVKPNGLENRSAP